MDVDPHVRAHAASHDKYANRLTVSVKEACEISGLGRGSVFKLIKSQSVQSKMLGARRLICLASLRGALLNVETKENGPGR